MWEFLKRSRTTPTAPKRDALEKALVDALKRAQDLAEQQQKTLDRIVTAQYERPVERVAPTATQSMPPWALSEALSVESDTEFFEAVGER